jgi:TRAP transporter TatT component family protein
MLRTIISGLLVLLAIFWFVSCRREPASAPPPDIDSGDNASAVQKIAEADQLYAQREDLSKVRLAIASLREARVADYGNYDAAWKLSKFNYFLATHTSDERERDQAFREGIDLGRIAVQLQGDKPDGHFWLGANYGGDAKYSTLAGLANVQDIRSEMETVLKLDEKYEGASPYLVLGELYLEAPRVLGGNTQKAIEYLEKGLKVEGNNGFLRLHLAKAYHAAKRDKDALVQIDYIMKMTPYPEYAPEYKEAVRDAQKLKDEIDKT